MRKGILLASLGIALAFAVGGGAESAAVRITGFWPASGTHYPGDTATSALKFKNNGNRLLTFWIGYSVQDGAGRWYDVPSHSVALEPGRVSGVQRKTWTVPADPLSTTGRHRVRMSVWKGRPESGGATRLASAEEPNAFHAFNFRDDFAAFDASRWSVLDRKLGRSRLNPANVSVACGTLQIKVPAGTLEGGAVKSATLYGYGSYYARIKVPDAPSSITGFFLYDAPDYEKEIDVEIFNDGSRRVLFSTYAPHHPDGTVEKRPTHTVTRELPFDPRAGFHDYAFVFHPDRVRFYADGKLMQSWSDGLPTSPMHLYINTWFSTWLSGEKPQTDSYTYVDRVIH